MAILLTGASGFVGRTIARALLARHEDIVLFAPSMPGVAPEDALGQARFVAGDIRSDGDLDRAFGAATIDRVIHAAALTPDAEAEAEQPGAIIDVNLGGTARLMQAARRAGVSRVLGFSSAAVYGLSVAEPDGWLHEDRTIPRPAGIYGATKLAAETVIARLGTLYGIETTVIRLGPCFGVGEYATGVRPMLSPQWQCAEAARSGRDCVLPRAMRADWVDVEDAATAIADLLETPVWSPGPINLAGGAETTAASWCDALTTLRPGFQWRIDPGTATVRYGLGHDRPPMDMSRLRGLIARTPCTDDLIGRARRYLAWRDSAEGIALCGA